MSFQFREDGQTGGGGPAPEACLHHPPVTPRDSLQQLPALILLNRLTVPVLALGLDGEIVYANPAFAAMLGYPDVSALTELSLGSLMAGHTGASGRNRVAALRSAAGTVAEWRHADDYHLHAVISKTLLVRATDAVLLITLTDVTDVLWNTKA